MDKEKLERILNALHAEINNENAKERLIYLLVVGAVMVAEANRMGIDINQSLMAIKEQAEELIANKKN